MIKHLMMSSKFLKLLLSGRKKTTIRPGVLRVANQVFIHSRGQIEAIASVSHVVYKKVRDLTERDALVDGFKSREELVAYLKKRYPGLRDDSTVTIIYFDKVERTSIPEDLQYGGLTPVEVAKIALQRLKLSERESEILKTIVETGSLRKASAKLFGTIEKRWVIRKILKRVLTRLRDGEPREKTKSN
ncbi:MAG: ASCH domain-containing protein [Pyrobaculum sp.]